MTHPNVEYWAARVQISAEKNLEVQKSLLTVQIPKSADNNELFDTLVCAHARLAATQKLAESLIETVKFYEEQIALLK